MTYPTSDNPYASPPAAPPLAAYFPGPTFKPIDRIEHWRMYQYIFQSPSWMTNILFGALCSIIPVVGPLVMMGYQFEIVSALLASQGSRYPDFTFNRIADYLVRGLWPFLVQLVASLVLMPVILVVVLVPMMVLFGVGAAAGEDAAPGVLLVVVPIFVIFTVLISVVMTMALVPPMIRAGLAQDFMEGFNFGWAVDFLKKTCKELFIALLFLICTAAVLAILGVLACFVGLFVVMPIIFLAQAHLYYQLYLLYLSRGGTPVPQKALPYTPQPYPPGP